MSVDIFEKDQACNLKIIVPTLKNLALVIEVLWYELHIKAPALECLYFRGHLSKDIMLENMPNLIKASPDTTKAYLSDDIEDYGNRVWAFIRALYNVKSLHFYTHISEVKHVFHGL